MGDVARAGSLVERGRTHRILGHADAALAQGGEAVARSGVAPLAGHFEEGRGLHLVLGDAGARHVRDAEVGAPVCDPRSHDSL